MTPATNPTTPQAANAPAWIEPAPKAPRRLHVTVRTETGARHEYEALFASTWDAYDDALDRFALAARIEVKPAETKGESHGKNCK